MLLLLTHQCIRLADSAVTRVEPFGLDTSQALERIPLHEDDVSVISMQMSLIGDDKNKPTLILKNDKVSKCLVFTDTLGCVAPMIDWSNKSIIVAPDWSVICPIGEHTHMRFFCNISTYRESPRGERAIHSRVWAVQFRMVDFCDTVTWNSSTYFQPLSVIMTIAVILIPIGVLFSVGCREVAKAFRRRQRTGYEHLEQETSEEERDEDYYNSDASDDVAENEDPSEIDDHCLLSEDLTPRVRKSDIPEYLEDGEEFLDEVQSLQPRQRNSFGDIYIGRSLSVTQDELQTMLDDSDFDDDDDDALP